MLLGDREMAEGSVWEAFDKAGHCGLHSLIAILDMNRLGQRGPTDLGWNAPVYAARARAFEWHAIQIDGHEIEAIDAAHRKALDQHERPTCIVARTAKGSGVSFLADHENWHGKALSEADAQKAITELGGEPHVVVTVQKPDTQKPARREAPSAEKLPDYAVNSTKATRKAFGDALAAVGANLQDVVALDGEVSNSKHTGEFTKAYPDRFFEIYIAEQQMVSAAVGLAAIGKRPFAATFACFLMRALDQIRMAAVSGVSIRLCGSHADVSIGEDGPSQMGLEDLAMMRAVHESTVLYPCDANQTARLVDAMAGLDGIAYLRTTRIEAPVIYAPEQPFGAGGSVVVRRSHADRATVVAAGVTVYEALKAYEQLRMQRISVRVIDAYSVKPIDRDTLLRSAEETRGRLVVVEDHWPDGTLGDAVLEAFAGIDTVPPVVVKLAVRSMSGSGTPDELKRAAGLDAERVVQAVHGLLSAQRVHGVRVSPLAA